MKKILIFTTLLFLVIPILAFGTNGLRPGLTPDSPFYFFDTLGEKIGMFFTFGAEKKAEKAIYYADEKLAEIEKMAEENKVEAMEKANQNYQKYLELANQKVKEAKEKGKDIKELATLISEKILKHQKVLLEVYGKALDEAKAGIEKAIESSKKGFEEAVKNVSKVKREELQKKGNKIEKEMKCKKIQDLGKQNKCWIDLAKETKDENYCRNIETFEPRAECYTALAILKNNSSICEKIEKGSIYESCKEYFEIKEKTADWKTYTEKFNRFSIKYPKSWMFKETRALVEFAPDKDSFGKEYFQSPIWIYFMKVEPRSDFNPYPGMCSLDLGDVLASKTTIKIEGYSVDKLYCKKKDDIKYIKAELYVPSVTKLEKFVGFYLYDLDKNPYEDIFDTMLSTFRFLE